MNRKSMNSNYKYCPKCEVIKSLDKFAIRKDRKSGRASWCKLCFNKYTRTNIYQNTRTRERLERHRLQQREQYRLHPEKFEARRLAAKYSTKKPECERCGAEGKLHMHHIDYSKPLEVVTLCIPCHEIAHHGVIA